jgi:hypothetical protein
MKPKTKRSEPKLPASFYCPVYPAGIKWEAFNYDFSFSATDKQKRLKALQEEVRFLRSRRYMDTFRLSLERVKAHACTFVIGVLAAIALLSFTGCATTGGGSLVVKGDGFCVCVDPSYGVDSPLEGWCYKVNDVTVGAESISAPQ